MQMVMKNTGPASSSFPIMGIIRVRATYEFRGRRLDDEELLSSKPSIVNQPQTEIIVDGATAKSTDAEM